MRKPWHISIDTGGTFTDCLATSPEGDLLRTKVLSNSTLRGRISECVSAFSFSFRASWDVSEDIFKGYKLKILGTNFESRIESVNFESGVINLEHSNKLANYNNCTFEITSEEEVPVLAARILTHTPLDQQLPPIDLRLGSTRGTNALLERKGAKTLFVVTKGFSDLVEIGTQARPNLFALNIIKRKMLYSDVLEVSERIDHEGNVLNMLLENDFEMVAEFVKQGAYDSIAIAFMNSYKNPTHEVILKKHLVKCGYNHVSISSELATSIKMLPRAETCIVNAYLDPVLRDYVGGIKDKLGSGSFKIMTSAGGLVNVDNFNPKDSLLSGPAGGIVGSASKGQLSKIDQVLTLDMGGTSTDVARYSGHFDYRYETVVADAHIVSPALAIETIAAGGGSICAYDGYRLTVGPESAGASPGPACYGDGGPLTITDVNLLLGRIVPGNFGIPLDIEKAREAAELIRAKVAAESVQALILGYLDIANEKMAEAIRKISVSRGYDPKEYALLGFGGAGGQHACAVANLLGMNKVLVPYDAGLLSAYGIGEAVVERFAEKDILRVLRLVDTEVLTTLEQLGNQALDQLKAEGFEADQVAIRHQLLYLRFHGQDSSLEVPYSANYLDEFKSKYKDLFGHWVEDREIELASIKVVGSSISTLSKGTSSVGKIYEPTPAYITAENRHVHYWEALDPGATISGPAIVGAKTSTTFVEAGWVFTLDSNENAVITKVKNIKAPVEHELEETQLELFTNRFTAIAEEMGALLQRASFSVNIKERLDFSCALLDPDGELIVNAPHIPVHLGSLGMCVRLVKDAININEGDVIITNHPGYGGSHLPDITLISGVFKDQKLVGYVANRAHHAEVGGIRPGSTPPNATNLEQEGVIIKPTYLVKGGEAQWQQIENLFVNAKYPTRALSENMADLNGALASIRAGVAELIKLSKVYGAGKVGHYMDELKHHAAKKLGTKLAELGEANLAAEEKLDDGTLIKVQISTGSKTRIDFSGTSAKHKNNLNATPAIVSSAILYVLRLLADEEIPLNEGLMENIELVLPTCFLSPEFSDDGETCPAVVGGNTETSQRLVDTLLKAFGMAACSQGTMNNLLFGNDDFGYYETICGGVGAGNGFNGATAVHQHMTNTRITDPEIMELRYPVRVHQFAIRKNSGGDGKWEGGDGVIRELEFLDNVQVTTFAQHRNVAPYGLNGGNDGQVGEQIVVRASGEREQLNGIDGRDMKPGDRLIMETPGGGGFGSA